jgi:aspartyl-tRNA(Asn)/glutamyl-tRNA(Gln) amidotransferase subunit C
MSLKTLFHRRLVCVNLQPTTFPLSLWRFESIMALTLDDMNKIAHLARVGLSDDEKNRYTESLNNILGLINELQAVNTSGIEPLAHALEVTQPLRADVVTERNQRDAYQAIAPAVQDGLYLVPKVME